MEPSRSGGFRIIRGWDLITSMGRKEDLGLVILEGDRLIAGCQPTSTCLAIAYSLGVSSVKKILKSKVTSSDS